MKETSKTKLLALLSIALFFILSIPNCSISSLTQEAEGMSLIGDYQSEPGIKNIFEDDELSKILEVESKKERMLDPTMIIHKVVAKGNGRLKVVGSGTGFGVHYDRKTDVSYVLTNAHICEGGKGPEILMGTRSKEQKVLFSFDEIDLMMDFVDEDPKRDLCLLRTYGYVKPVKIASKAPKQFDELYVVGAPSGNFPIIIKTYTSGYLSRSIIKDMESGSDNPFLFVSEIIHAGNSGSPVFNKRGKLVGVIFAGPLRGRIFGATLHAYGGLAVPLDDVKDFLEEHNIQ